MRRLARAGLLISCLTIFCGSRVSRAEGSAAAAGPNRSWSRVAAERWLERAERLVARGDTAAAISCYTEALRTDPTLGEAYLGLAAIRQAFGDQREAEWLLTRATSLADVRAEALSRRARFYRALGRDALAVVDLENAALADPSPARQRELAELFVERRAWAAALAVWRKIRVSLAEEANETERREADETIAALSLLAAETDAAQHDAGDHGWIRRALRHRALQGLHGTISSPK